MGNQGERPADAALDASASRPGVTPADPTPPDADDDEELVGGPWFVHRSESESEPVVARGHVGAARATGRRKQAVARVYLKPGDGAWAINGRPLGNYFPNPLLRQVVQEPLNAVGRLDSFDIVVRVHGGGISGQDGAIRLGIARALNEMDIDAYRAPLKSRGMLTRDARAVERKKAGLKKARKAPQYSKR